MRSRVMLAAALLSALVLASPASGGDAPDWRHTPSSGPPGTTITIDGTCADDTNAWEAVFIYFVGPAGRVAETSIPITPGVAWTVNITVPADSPIGPYEVAKQCARLDEAGEFDGGEATSRAPFTVTAETSTTSTTSTPSTTSQSTATTTAPSVAPAATPSVAVQGSPDYTG